MDSDASGSTSLQEADGSILKAKVQPVPTEVVWPSAELPPEHRPLLYAPKPIAWHKDRHNRMHTRLGPRRRVYRQGLAPESVAALTQARNMVTICSNPACRRLVDLHSALIDAHKEGRTELTRSDGCTSHLCARATDNRMRWGQHMLGQSNMSAGLITLTKLLVDTPTTHLHHC